MCGAAGSSVCTAQKCWSLFGAVRTSLTSRKQIYTDTTTGKGVFMGHTYKQELSESIDLRQSEIIA